MDSKKVLDECSNKLRTSLYINDDEACFLACRQILEWGGVTNKNIDRISRMKNRCDYFKYVIKVLEIDNDLEDYINTDIIMNSGFTKIYSLIVEDFVIYDSRVGAALGLLVKYFCEETKKEKIPEELRFAWGIKRKTLYGQIAENPRNPSNQIYKFPLINNSKIHIMNNNRANWLLKEILNKTNSKFHYLDEGMALRALEAALFMIGYEVRDFEYENTKSRLANLGLFSVTQASIPDESKIVISALEESIAWQIGSVTSTRLSKTDCKSERKSCLKRVILEASGTLVKPQNSRRCLEYLRKTRSNESVGIEKIRWMISAHKKACKGYLRDLPVDA